MIPTSKAFPTVILFLIFGLSCGLKLGDPNYGTRPKLATSPLHDSLSYLELSSFRSDPNWWKGANWRGEGLFPANFVTTDLNVKPEQEDEDDEEDGGAGATVEGAAAAAAAEVLTIDEDKINKTLAMLQNADPTEEIEKDPADLVTYEEQCHKVYTFKSSARRR